MTAMPDFADTRKTCPDDAAALLPVDPFTALRIHFGMLLGVDDFETLQAYQRGKMRIHNSWLHGPGVVWGLGLSTDQDSGEVRVDRGLALDAAGHELHLEAEACLAAGDWFDAHRTDGDFYQLGPDGTEVTFDAHVIMKFRACQTRQVPALSDSCDGSASTAYSRVFETVELHMVAGRGPDPGTVAPAPYHRLRLLFGLDAALDSPDDQAIVNDRGSIEDLPGADQPSAYLARFRRYAALDAAELSPATSVETAQALLFPAPDDTPVLLGNVHIALEKTGNGWRLDSGAVDVTVRPTLVSAPAIQELLCGPALLAAPPGQLPGGSRALPETVQLSGTTLTLSVDKPLQEASVTVAEFVVTVFGSTGWRHITMQAPTLDANHTQVTLHLDSDPAADPNNRLLRLTVFGTGETPLLGEDLVPFGGGTDFVHMIKLGGS